MGALVLMGGSGLEKIKGCGAPPCPSPPPWKTINTIVLRLGMFFGNFSLWSSVLKIFLKNFLFLTHFTGYLWLLKKIKLFLRTHF